MSKERDVIRSLLPSTRRNWAKWKGRLINRQARRAIKQFIQIYDLEKDESDLVIGIGWAERTRQRRQRRRVQARRSDKLGTFFRWCKFKTKEIEDNEDKYFAVKSLLGPGNVITQHAMTHWADKMPFNKIEYDYTFWAREGQKVIATKTEFTNALRRGFESCHKAVNRILKGHSGNCINLIRHVYKECEYGKDPCIEQVVHRYRMHIFHVPSGSHFRTCTVEPKRRHPKSWFCSKFCTHLNEFRVHETSSRHLLWLQERIEPVNSYVKEEVKERHDYRECKNVVLIKHPDDVEKVCEYFFRGGQSLYSRNSWYVSDLRRERTIEQLLELFKRKGFIN